MATILYKYALYKGYTIPQNRAALNYADANQFSWWAVTAINRLSAAGVFNHMGVDGAIIFAPQGTATRAQVATVFMNFMRFVVGANADTATANINQNPSTGAPQTAVYGSMTYAYIDRRAMEEIERALTTGSGGMEPDNTV
jgi:hypothetical protein